MTKTAEILKDLFALIDDKCEINFYGNDGFDNQEKVNGKELLKKYIQDAVRESVNQFQVKLPTDEKIAITFPIYGGDESELLDEINQYRREGAKWMRDQIKNQLENKE